MEKHYMLNNGMQVPEIGFGTYKVNPEENKEIFRRALEAGYRYFDTASFYDNEDALGEVLKESGMPREELFLASKVWKTEMGYEETKAALERSLAKLQTEYLDLYLIHWPIPSAECKDWKQLNIDTWRAMEELQREGKVKAIGLSNFLPHHIENILQNCTIKPVIDQLELHPGYMQEAAIQYCREHDIAVQAWSPMARGRIFDNKLLVALAKKYKVSVAQICLQYLKQRNILIIPKASSLERMKENLYSFSFELDREEMQKITSMPQCGWGGGHPDPELEDKK